MDIDWNELWKQQMQLYLDSLDKSQEAYWEKEAAIQFNEFNQQDNWRKGRKIISELDVRPGDRVLDIGSGPGSVAIPLSSSVKEILAVEPNRHMVDLLKENISGYHVTNISIVEKLWDDIDVCADLDAPYDIVLSSFSLGVMDLRDSLEKMIAAASRDIYIFWFSGTTWHERDRQFVYESILDKPYHPSPKADIVFNVLYDMGIFPNMASSPGGPTRTFASFDDLRSYFMKKYKIGPDHDSAMLDTYLAGRAARDGDTYVFSESHVRTKIWWQVDGGD
jgi:SAM-dependent methyltransferase